MINKLHKHLEEKVLGGLNLKKEFVLVEMTTQDYERFMKMSESAQIPLVPMHRGDPDVKIYNYNGVVLKIRVGKKTSDFLK